MRSTATSSAAGHAIDKKAIKQARREFRAMASRGINTVRLQVQAEGMTAARLSGLRNVVNQARGAGLVTVISNVDSSPAATVEVMRSLARTYRQNPYVWLQPRTSSNCAGTFADPARCESWAVWKAEQTNYVKAIRNGGMRSPVLVGTPRGSADAALLGHYRLGDRNIVYGVHVDGGGHEDFGAAERELVEKAIGVGAGRIPLVVDDLSRAPPPARPRAPASRAATSPTSPTGSCTAAATAPSRRRGTRARRTAWRPARAA